MTDKIGGILIGNVKVFVVMGNDYPDAVFSTLELAEAYCEKQRRQQREASRPVYWRPYPFVVDNDPS
jgi:hypothetical protein